MGPIYAIVYVNGAAGVNVSGLIIDGSQANVSATGCAEEFFGIFYSGSGGSITHNAVRFIEQPLPLFGCQTGLAIIAENPNGVSNTLTISGNSVHDFAKNGITVVDDGLTATISGNTVLGIGPTTLVGQNGIQVGPGGTATVTGNNASGFVYTPCSTVADCGDNAASGILAYDSVGVTITGNTVGLSQGGIYVYNDNGPGNAVVSKNGVSATLVFDGIALDSSGNTVSNNIVTNSAESGIGLYESGNTISANTIVEAPAGILIEAQGASTISGNKYLDVVQLVQTSIPPPPPGAALLHVKPFRSR